MKNDAEVILFNTSRFLTDSENKEKEHIYSDALVIRKNDSNYLLTVHGDCTAEIHDTVDGNIDYVCGTRHYYHTHGMYKISSFEAKILSSVPPKSLIFKGTLKRIRDRQNLLDVELDKESKKTRSAIVNEDRALALDKQSEYGVALKQRVEAQEKLQKEQKERKEAEVAFKTKSILDKFTIKR